MCGVVLFIFRPESGEARCLHGRASSLRQQGYLNRVGITRRTFFPFAASPHRLDIDWIHCKRAKALGVKLVINPDAHATEEIAFTKYGVDVARRGWLEKADVFNTQTLEEVTKELEGRKKRLV